MNAPSLHFGQIFNYYSIICREKEFSDPNYMGSLHRSKDLNVILVNTCSKNKGRINFTKAHELGQFCLNHKGVAFQCTKTDMSNFTNKPQEIEANQFALEFLLPEKMRKLISLTAPFDFDTIHSLSNEFLVSQIVAIFRVLDFNNGNYAFVNSKDGKITHSKLCAAAHLIGKLLLYPEYCKKIELEA
jgi:Zn-dependent peptidase ImmA (M78 family)